MSFNDMFELMPKWRVHVLFGASEVDASGPVAFGNPQIYVGEESTEASVPLVYEGVHIRSADSGGRWMGLQTPNEDGTTVTHRELWQVFSVVFEDMGAIRVEGMELGDNGVLHAAIWELTPLATE